MTKPCDRSWEVDLFRAGRLGPKDAVSFERHLRTCAACQAQRDADEWLQQFARRLTDDEPPELGLRRVRGRVLRDAATGVRASGRGSWWPRLALLGLLLAGVVGTWAVVTRSRPARGVATTAPLVAPPSANLPDPFAASVVAESGSRWEQERMQGVERVTLEEGSLHLHVRPQTVGERFLVVLPDGELEVRGTTFDVRVEHDATVRVKVEEGVVELRIRNLESRRLGAGDGWTPVSSAPSSTKEAAIPTPMRSPPRPAPSRDAPGRPLQAASPEVYLRAMALLRAGRNEEAASAFHSFAQSQPTASQAEDASFLEAVALARAGRGDAAGLAAQRHLESFPGSFHRRQASLLVAKAAAQRGDCSRARSVLAPWPTDPEAIAALSVCPP
ncbi:MAG TPA: FecR domain-containing protein [Polyangiaceae bacterium]|jgi:hypothetical protein